MTTLEKEIRQAQGTPGNLWEYGDPANLQALIDSGSVWSLEGSAGRAAMQALESGACFLPEKPSRDYWGNRIPERGDLKPGTKGTLENAARFWGVTA